MDCNEAGVFEMRRLAVGSVSLTENTLHLQFKSTAFFTFANFIDLLIQMENQQIPTLTLDMIYYWNTSS